jgi:hypothetical protein
MYCVFEVSLNSNVFYNTTCMYELSFSEGKLTVFEATTIYISDYLYLIFAIFGSVVCNHLFYTVCVIFVTKLLTRWLQLLNVINDSEGGARII